jgi:F-type H+-transporting ATPase subunit b
MGDRMHLRGLVLGLMLAVAAMAWLAASAPAADAHPAVKTLEADATCAAHEEANSNPLEFKSDLAIWTAVVFLVLLLILWKFAWGPICEGLEKREQYIASQIAHAEKSNEDARGLLSEYQQKLSGAEGEVRAILDQARRDAEQTGREMIETARGEAKLEREKAVREIEQASTVALEELAAKGADLAVELAGKIVGAKLQAADHAALIQQTVADFNRAKPSNN